MKLLWWAATIVFLWYVWHKFDDAAFKYVDEHVQGLLPRQL